MKKLYALLGIMLAALFAMKANAITITFNVDNPDNVSLEIEYAEMPLVAGDNPFTFDAYSSVKISAKNGANLVSVKEENGLYDPYLYNNSVSMYPGSTLDGARFIIITKGAEEIRTASLKVNVDKASAVKAVFDETQFEANLADGENTVKYDPENEKTLKIYSSVSAQMPLYKVTLDGATTGSLSQRNNVYFLSLPTDGTLNILSQFPDKDCKVNFTFNEGGQDFVTKVCKDNTDGEELDIAGGSFTVKAGTVLYIYGNTDDYLLSSYAVDGTVLDFHSPQRLIVSDNDVNVNFTATAYAKFNVTVSVDDPEAIVAHIGSFMSLGQEVVLAAGDNTVTVNENRNSLVFEPANVRDYSIASVTLNGVAIESNYAGNVQVADLAANDKIVITTNKVVRDIHTVIYLDNADENMWDLKDASGSNIPLATGYNHIMLAEADNPLTLCQGYGMPYVYANDEPVEASGSMFNKSYKFSLSQGSVAKIYVAADEEPAFHALTFTGNGFALADVLADEITPVTIAAGYEVLDGTKIDITAKKGKKIYAKLDGEDLAAGEDGKYSFTVSSNHNIELTDDETTAVADVDIYLPAAAVIYTLQGIRVKAADVNSLPAGLYIVNGVKTLVK